MLVNASMPHQPPDPDLVPLVRMAIGGNEEAFGKIFHLYYPRIRAFGARMLGDIGEGEDVAQETMVRAARTVRSLRTADRFESWLFRIAGNLCRDRLRARQREERGLETFANEPAGTKHAQRRIEDALGLLPTEQRAAVLFVYFDGFNHREAARAMGCAETTVSWHLMLARRTLKKLLTP